MSSIMRRRRGLISAIWEPPVSGLGFDNRNPVRQEAFPANPYLLQLLRELFSSIRFITTSEPVLPLRGLLKATGLRCASRPLECHRSNHWSFLARTTRTRLRPLLQNSIAGPDGECNARKCRITRRGCGNNSITTQIQVLKSPDPVVWITYRVRGV